ncbi:phage tail protein [Vibrio splendidus]
MANVSDKSILTAAGKALLAQLNAEEKALVIDKMIFANVPNRPEYPQPDDVVPTDNVVHQAAVEQRGRLSEDSVIYSTTLASNEGPFEFNWTGAYCSEYGVLVTIDHHSLTPKTVDEPGVSGNTLVRSVVLEYKDIAEITNITVDASTWQYNATPRMKKMDNDVAQANIDQNGKDWFIEEGFLVTPQASAFSIKAGAGYVSGNRVALEFDRSIQVPNKPSFIYIDAHREGTPTGEQVTLFNFVVSAEEKDDYIDSSTGKDVPHFVCKIAQVLGDGSVSDLRPEGESASRDWVSDEVRLNSQSETNTKQLKGKISALIGKVINGHNSIYLIGDDRDRDKIYNLSPSPSNGEVIQSIDLDLLQIEYESGETSEMLTLEQVEQRKKGVLAGWLHPTRTITAALILALSSAMQVTTAGESYTIDGFTQPQGSILRAEGGTLTVNNYWYQEHGCQLIEVSAIFVQGGIAANGKNNLYNYKCDIKTLETSDASAFLYQNGSQATFIDTDATSFHKNGIYTEGMDYVNVSGGDYTGNGRSGLLIGGGRGHNINPKNCNSNGDFSTGTYSGIIIARSTDFKIGSPFLLDNAEHGLSIQGCVDFDVEWPYATGNGNSGVCFQDNGTGEPVKDFSFGGTYMKNIIGIKFLDECVNGTMKAGTTSINNTDYQVRLVDLAQSGRYSNNITGKGCNFNTSIGARVVNSNNSKNINISEKHNNFRELAAEVKNTVSVIEMLTLDVSATDEIIYVSGSTGTDVTRTYSSAIIDGREITLHADDEFRVRHMSGTPGTAPFNLIEGSTKTILAGRSIKFLARNGVWNEI